MAEALAGAPLSLQQQRQVFEEEHAAVPPADGCRITPISAGPVNGELIVPPGADRSRAILYHHGGGFAFGSALSHRHMVSRLAAAAGVAAYNMDYPLAPEHPFPAGLESSYANFQYVLSQGILPANMVVCGESAGGNLTAALLLKLRDEGRRCPAGAFLLSPWLDLSQSGATYAAKAASDPLVSKEILDHYAAAYCGARSRDDFLVSPLKADLRGFPPVLIQAGSAEVLLDDAINFAHRAALADVDVTLHVWPDMVHAWPLFEHRLPLAAALAIEEAAGWIRNCLSSVAVQP